MRIQPNETYEQWAIRVQEFELAQAKRDMAMGMDINLALESMSMRIQQKMLHPILVAIRNTSVDVDIDANRKSYEETYLKHNKPKSDHVED